MHLLGPPPDRRSRYTTRVSMLQTYVISQPKGKLPTGRLGFCWHRHAGFSRVCGLYDLSRRRRGLVVEFAALVSFKKIWADAKLSHGRRVVCLVRGISLLFSLNRFSEQQSQRAFDG